MLNEIMQAWFPVVATFGGIATTAAIYYVNSRIDSQVEAAKAEINKRTDDIVLNLMGQIGAQHDRITKLEAHWESLPSRDDFHKMALQFERMAGDIKAMNEKMSGLDDKVTAAQRSTQRINDFLMNEKANS